MLKGFDFSFIPSSTRCSTRHRRFIERNEIALVYGPIGVGKSYIAQKPLK